MLQEKLNLFFIGHGRKGSGQAPRKSSQGQLHGAAQGRDFFVYFVGWNELAAKFFQFGLCDLRLDDFMPAAFFGE